MMSKITNKIKQYTFALKWRRMNQHNSTRPVSVFPVESVEVGKYTYGRLDVETYGTAGAHLKIGSFCSIAREVRFLLDGEHDYTRVSTFPFRVHMLHEGSEALTKGPIVVEDDVWIGERSMVLSGVTIGQGAVIAAGSIVSKDVPPYVIFAKGQVIKYRFSEEIIDSLLKFDYSRLTVEEVKENMDLLYGDIEKFIESDLYKRHVKE